MKNLATAQHIVVDLDGTLVNTDMLVENVFAFLRLHPLRVFVLFFWLWRGKAYFKKQLAEAIVPDVTGLPYNKALLVWLKLEKEKGARLTLATASHHLIANKIAEHLGIFDEVMATEDVNLASKNKSEALNQRFNLQGYEYVGNSHADIAVWKTASVAHVVNPERGVLAAVRKLDNVGQVFDDRLPYLRTLFKSLRILLPPI